MRRVLLAAASPLARAGLEALLTGASEVEVVGVIPVSALAAAIGALQPEVVVVEGEGDELDSAVLANEAVSVVLVGEADTDVVRHGVSALLPVEADAETIRAAITLVASGLVVVPRAATPVLPPAADVPGMVETLTPREIEVLRLMSEGAGNKEIARRLAISEHTVKFHVGSILGKLGAGSRTEAVTLGIRLGIIFV